MLQIIGALILLVIGFVIIKALFKASLNILGVILGLGALIVAGPPLLAGYIVERVTYALHSRWLLGVPLAIAGMVISFMWGLDGKHIAYEAYSFDSMKFILTAAFASGLLAVPVQTKAILQNGLIPADINAKLKEYYCCFYTSYFLMACSAATPFIAWQYNISSSLMWWTGLLYWIAALLTQFYAANQIQELKKLTNAINTELNEQKAINNKLWLTELKEGSNLSAEFVETIYLKLVSQHIFQGDTREQDLAGENWLLNDAWYERKMAEFNEQLNSKIVHSSDELRSLFGNRLNLPSAANDDLLNRYLDGGNYYSFSDGRKFVSFHYVDELCTCTSCGLSEIKNAKHQGGGGSQEWYCSDICRETEKLCIEIHKRPQAEFISSAATNGLILMTLPEAWNTNEKMFAVGGQGHGFAAERGNHLTDKIQLKDAHILGDDNAKNGADRLVNGSEIQTKYCATAARSVGAGFDGQNGNYRYYDSNGTPMQLEVPKDQYSKALETMENKIRDGKVPGVTDPAEATKLVRQGHLTYSQAQNITKFGTFESITYDIAEGSIISLAAGGISFGLTASIFYLNTGDRKAALQTAAIQAGKTFTRTLTVYVTVQQLHRISAVQGLLKNIDFAAASPTVRNALQQGVGANNLNSLNKMMRGTLVTSFALVAVTTGPDMIKMVRGRISGAQFIKNLAVTSSGVAGGAIGSIAGGMMLSPLGPFGALAGRAAGGLLGGMIATAISKKIAGALVEDDRVKVLALIQEQVTWLATSFMLTEHELENLNANLATVIDQKTLEVIFAAKEQDRATANMLIKPLVVSVVKQRPVLSYEQSQICEMVDQLDTSVSLSAVA
ncbi:MULTISPECIES: hypothetical protein [Enterobacteriaceae]|uniref:hypothetical protein n=1 Tax=Enterobacteriaceae TaxID=543 RepID=UPI000DE751D6|nr:MULTISPECIES: hypothetical protein [Enterobacteriaceae]MBA8560177.1 hypothetical protein [Citrobacter freundii]HCA7079734.1 hypothetical protein [Citrobacter sedlakii]MEC5644235.1 hypothetical protein [Citrobacter koseri]WOJ17018.1 hypothetical protein R1018_19010 [Citrobacter koseri]WOJ20963.1 hypothetical protein R1015_17540 [Citrobacter koseri]